MNQALAFWNNQQKKLENPHNFDFLWVVLEELEQIEWQWTNMVLIFKKAKGDFADVRPMSLIQENF